MIRPMLKRIACTLIVGVSALLGTAGNARACHEHIHQYGIHGVVLPGGGFLIQQVGPFSEAAADGLIPGDLILQANNFQIVTLVHLQGPFSIAINSPAVAVLTVLRNGQVFTVIADL